MNAAAATTTLCMPSQAQTLTICSAGCRLTKMTKTTKRYDFDLLFNECGMHSKLVNRLIMHIQATINKHRSMDCLWMDGRMRDWTMVE